MKNRRLLLLLLPLATLAGYLLTGSFLLRSGTTLLCLFLILYAYAREVSLCAGRSTTPSLRSSTLFVAAALLLSFLGDYVLGHWGGSFLGFVCGVAVFLLAHLGYVAFCLCHGRVNWVWLAVLAAIFGAGYYGVLLRPRIGDAVTSSAVLAYVLVSCLSMAAALGLDKRGARNGHPRNTGEPGTSALPFRARFLFAAGIVCLLFSDLLIAQRRFLGDGTLYALMMPTYFASQLLATASILTNTRPL